jgi:bifunctional non-homologous end joining protein LigD
VLFDLLYLDGESLLVLSYDERRRHLESLGLEKGKGGSWTVSPRFDGPGSDILGASREQGLEGVVAKKRDSPYLPGKRSPAWIKVKNVLMQEVVIGGWTPGEGHRRGRFGSLLLGVPGPTGLEYVGQVGTGFTDAVLDDLTSVLDDIGSDVNPFSTEVPAQYRKMTRWVEPRLVGEVSFSEWTGDGRMRHPSWRGIRSDKDAQDVRRES